MFALLSAVAVLVVSLLIILQLQTSRASHNHLPYPPGPKPLPLIGNILDLPAAYQWLVYANWAKTYGDIVHIQVFGQHLIILSSVEALNDLLERRSAIYSDRPRMPMLVELMGWTWNLGVMRYGPKWRRHRKIFHHFFQQEATSKYRPVQLLEARKMMLNLLKMPGEFRNHVERAFTGSIMNITYGTESESAIESYASVAEETARAFAVAGNPGGFMVDLFPVLEYVPEWFPGATFKRTARYFRELIPEFVDKPFETAKMEMAAGSAKPSLVFDALENRFGEDVNEDYEADIKEVAANSFAGGSETTKSTLQVLFFALMHHPDVQRKAQEQLDRVVGRDRLPEFEDLQQCSYVRAIVMEIFRWQPVVPLAVPHTVTVDDEYRGYRIPKGSLVIGNAWAILHDGATYPNPHEFRPERFLHANGSYNDFVQSAEVASFGYGRRICPGRHFAIEGALIGTASILSCFDISPPEDVDYVNDDPTKPIMTAGALSFPLPFKCNIHPRTETTAAVIRQALQRLDVVE